MAIPEKSKQVGEDMEFAGVLKKLQEEFQELIKDEVEFTQSSFPLSKNIRQNSTYYFFMKIPNKRELQQITFNHSSDIYFKDFMNLCKKCTA